MLWGRGSFVVTFAVLLLVSGARAQDGATLRKWMYENDKGLIEATFHFDLDLDAGLERVGLSSLLQMQELGFVWATCVREGVLTQGTVEKLEMTKDELGSYLSLRVRNDLSFLPKCTNDLRDNKNAGQLIITLHVWTVGDSYPVAYDIKLTTYLASVGPHKVPASLNEPFSTEYLGYGNSDSVPNSIDHVIEESVRDMGTSYLRGTGQ